MNIKEPRFRQIATNLHATCEQIHKLAPNHKVQLIAVSKTYPASDIALAAAHGQNSFGENHPQELALKAELLKDLNLDWHFIGHIQGNKTRLIAEHANWVHSLESPKHALRLNRQRPDHLPALQVLLEVKISQDATKHGLSNWKQILELAQIIGDLPRLQLRGLMGIATLNASKSIILAEFNQLKNYAHQLKNHGFNLEHLSMGMSNDFIYALECGSTMLRIGSKIFGERNYGN